MITHVKRGASSQLSFGSNSAWGSIETAAIWKTHPTLPSIFEIIGALEVTPVTFIRNEISRIPRKILFFTIKHVFFYSLGKHAVV